jgi:hypothetical protein
MSSKNNNSCSSFKTAWKQNLTILEQHKITKSHFTNNSTDYNLSFNLQTALNHNFTILEQHKIKRYHFTNST